MISVEQILWFALGALAAGLIWAAFVPAFWRRAVRLTTERIERALPMSLDEIAAERDRLRARFAVDQRRIEQELESERAKLQAAHLETGRKTNELQEMAALVAARRADVEELERGKIGLLARIAALETDIQRLIQDRDVTITRLNGVDMVREALETKLAALSEVSDQRRISLAEANTARERMNLQIAELEAGQARLRQDIHAERDAARAAERRAREAESRVEILQSQLKRLQQPAVSASAALVAMAAPDAPAGERAGQAITPPETPRDDQTRRKAPEPAEAAALAILDVANAIDRAASTPPSPPPVPLRDALLPDAPLPAPRSPGVAVLSSEPVEAAAEAIQRVADEIARIAPAERSGPQPSRGAVKSEPPAAAEPSVRRSDLVLVETGPAPPAPRRLPRV